MSTSGNDPLDLWTQAAGDHDMFLALMRAHGHITDEPDEPEMGRLGPIVLYCIISPCRKRGTSTLHAVWRAHEPGDPERPRTPERGEPEGPWRAYEMDALLCAAHLDVLTSKAPPHGRRYG
jgi:hypothetical protein